MKTFKRYFPANTMRGQIFKLLFITGSMLILSAPLVYLQIYHPQHAASVSSFIAANQWAFIVFRYGLIVGFFLIWPKMIRYAGQKYEWETEKIHFWLIQRFRITIWLIIFELLVCQNIVFHLFR